jgi:hypothetical protein
LSPAINVPINPVVINKWNGLWSTGANLVVKIEFAGNYNATIDVVGCSCEVLSGTLHSIPEKVNFN